MLQVLGASFFGIEMSFLWYRGGPSLLLGIEIFFLVSRFCTLLFGIETVFFLGSTCACFWGLDILYIGGQRDLDTEKKIEKSRYQKKDISIPTKFKRVTRKFGVGGNLAAQCKLSPISRNTLSGCENFCPPQGSFVSNKTKGPGEKGAPRNHPVDFECRFPYDSYGRDRAPFWPFLGEGFWGNIQRPLVLPARLVYC